MAVPVMIKPKATTKSTKPTAMSRRLAAKPEHTRAGRLLEDVTGFYLNSGDFNGIRGLELAHRLGQPWPDIKQIIASLIEKELVGVLDEKSDLNPAIIRIGFEPKDVQLKKLDNSNLKHTFIYPGTAHLKTAVDPFNYAGRPYVLELALGNPQLSFRSFDLSVLEFYRNDPRYSYENRDIDGLISIRDEFYKSDQMAEKDQILLQSFGFSFDGKLNRAVAVFLRYLADLSPEHQQIWQAKELSESYEPVERKLDLEKAKHADVKRLELDEKKFRYLVNDNAMATEKTAEGIRKFAADVIKLEKFVASKLG